MLVNQRYLTNLPSWFPSISLLCANSKRKNPSHSENNFYLMIVKPTTELILEFWGIHNLNQVWNPLTFNSNKDFPGD